MPRAVRSRAAEGRRDAAFKALADATRRRILVLLAGEERSVGGLASHFPRISRPAVSKHLAVLKRAGLVTSRKRGRENLYAIAKRELHEAAGYVRDVDAFWKEQLNALDTRLRARDPE